MSFFDKVFGSKQQPAATPAPAPAQVTNNPAKNPPPEPGAASQVTDHNGVVPPGGNQPGSESPLEQFKDLWKTDPVDPNAQNNQPQNPTPQQLLEAASKVDFSRVLDQENLKKVTAGGEEAVTALVTLLNKHGQAIYGQNAVVTQKLIERAVEQAEGRFTEKIPSLVRKQSVRDGLVSENPAFKDPAVSAVVEMVQEQLAVKYPQATPTELQKMAKDYFSGAATKLSPQSPKSEPKKSGEDSTDWSDWFNTPTGT